ncbi:SDR family NAD(P)-dependent oxidoreductase, partial [Escherichia coli]
ATEIGRDGGRKVSVHRVDVGEAGQIQEFATAAISAHPSLNILINNAGVAGAEEMVVDMSVDAWNYTLDANLISNFLLMHHVVPLMKAQGSGYILNVSSYF